MSELFWQPLASLKVDPALLPPLVWAYIGDAVYELYVRGCVLQREPHKVHHQHRLATGMVKAEAQAAILFQLQDELEPGERDIVRRGRNAKPKHSAKNASELSYHRATGFEALIGYLYLNQQFDRLGYILQRSVELAGQ